MIHLYWRFNLDFGGLLDCSLTISLVNHWGNWYWGPQEMEREEDWCSASRPAELARASEEIHATEFDLASACSFCQSLKLLHSIRMRVWFEILRVVFQAWDLLAPIRTSSSTILCGLILLPCPWLPSSIQYSSKTLIPCWNPCPLFGFQSCAWVQGIAHQGLPNRKALRPAEIYEARAFQLSFA